MSSPWALGGGVSGVSRYASGLCGSLADPRQLLRAKLGVARHLHPDSNGPRSGEGPRLPIAGPGAPPQRPRRLRPPFPRLTFSGRCHSPRDGGRRYDLACHRTEPYCGPLKRWQGTDGVTSGEFGSASYLDVCRGRSLVSLAAAPSVRSAARTRFDRWWEARLVDWERARSRGSARRARGPGTHHRVEGQDGRAWLLRGPSSPYPRGLSAQ